MHPQFELRYEEVGRARAVYDRYVEVLPSVKAWVRFAKFELSNGDVGRARACYERAVEALGEDAQTVCVWGGGWVEEMREGSEGGAVVWVGRSVWVAGMRGSSRVAAGGDGQRRLKGGRVHWVVEG